MTHEHRDQPRKPKSVRVPPPRDPASLGHLSDTSSTGMVRLVVALLTGLFVTTAGLGVPVVEPSASASELVTPPTSPIASPLTESFVNDLLPEPVPPEPYLAQRPGIAAAKLQPASEAARLPLPAMAAVDDLLLLSPGLQLVKIGFHEAYHRDREALSPVGYLIDNLNPTRISAPDNDQRGSDYLIMHSRGRAASPTSAIDIAMPDDEPVIAPVDGVVSEVRPTLQSGQYPDLRIEIIPDADPDLRVIVIHVDEVQVAAGDRVVAGVSQLAGTARRFPFFSQIDAHTGDERWPHVHIEVQRIASETSAAATDA